MANTIIYHENDSGWLKLESTTTTGSFYYRKKGDFLFFHTVDTKPIQNLPKKTDIVAGVLPMSYRPKRNLTFAVRSVTSVGTCTIGSDGNVYLGNFDFDLSPNNTMWMSGCFSAD